MKRNPNITKDSIPKLYLSFLWPSIAGMLATSFYILVDTVFIGQSMGKLGLAALDISLPIYNVLSAIGHLLGIGGATAYGASLGRRKGITWHALISGISAAFLCLIAGRLFITKICLLLGSSSETLSYVRVYVGTLLNFSPFMILTSLLVPIISNDNAQRLAMWSFFVGGLINIILDAWFIFGLGWGMLGAALATGIAQIASFLILCLHLISSTCNLDLFPGPIQLKTMGRIILNGLPSFIIEISAGIVIFLFNHILIKLMGELGLAIYSIIANISFIVVSVYTGIANALQPLVSINYGAAKWKRVAGIRNISLISAFAFGSILLLVGLFFPSQIITLFIKNEAKLLLVGERSIRLYFLGFLPMGVNIALGTYFQSMEFTRHAIFISLGRGIVFVILGLLILPGKLGIDGIWLTIPFAETLALFLGVILAWVKLKPI